MTVLKFQKRNKTSKPSASVAVHADGRIDSIVLGTLTPVDRKSLASAIEAAKQAILQKHRAGK